MKRINEYIVPIQGLSDGNHHFDFIGDDHLLQYFPNELCNKGNINATISLDKKGNIYDFRFHLNGNLNLNCDLCLEEYTEKLNKNFQMIIKHSDKSGEHIDGNIEFKYVGHDCSQINLAKDLYDYVLLSIPLKKCCNKTNCSKLSENFSTSKSNPTIDSRWQKLTKLK